MDKSVSQVHESILEEDCGYQNGVESGKSTNNSPKKVNRSISESVQYKNCDSGNNEIPENLTIRLQTSGKDGMPNEIDCVCEAVGKDSSSVQYSCEYQTSSIGSPKSTTRSKLRRVGVDMTDGRSMQEENGISECIQRTKKMAIENLPASRIHGKFSLNIPYVFQYFSYYKTTKNDNYLFEPNTIFGVIVYSFV